MIQAKTLHTLLYKVHGWSSPQGTSAYTPHTYINCHLKGVLKLKFLCTSCCPTNSVKALKE